VCAVSAVAGAYNGARNGVRFPITNDWTYSSATVGATGVIMPLPMTATWGAFAAYGVAATLSVSILVAATCAGLGHTGAYLAVKYYFE